ncbi:hypothetical protein OQJ35_09995 [Legionella pneumophila]|uniref:hypothetical protein n=1 Tax=Legionella pneumophila TaxID=446 RepID=UPI0004B33256|nr:hypothetical protein [Legionella pneumophila]MCW8428850.1 hypothetical protein [Legionella pneumophila]HBD9458171.1 hypothetical protein [Legionella pneumophila]HCD9290243.1 hypothetical protein [Legionella pneumophila]HCD9470441.1 hypothetical protein [Legionella pneumophila]HEH5979256.1 hypothetical protein [Legionella pneumophila]
MKTNLVQHLDNLEKDINSISSLRERVQKDMQLLSIHGLFMMCIIGYSNLLSDK